ncbi:PhnD/SsuA/transferrin family substrate-binding protein [Vibrio profundum]|uniref:PhnD/SsuA/transferrin family substrate-binding protein n=1 Tax=Vibrio profundum TaxID=2910247 RepID=UPI003D0F592D
MSQTIKLFDVRFIAFLFVLLSKPVMSVELTFGVYTSDKPTTMHDKFSPILTYIEHKFAERNKEVSLRLKIYASYSEALIGLVNGKVDIARLGPASYILVKRQEPGIKILAMEHKQQQRRFSGVFITATEAPFDSLAEVKGKTLAFGDKNSTIGRYLAQAELIESGIHACDLKTFRYLNRHDKVALAVANGQYDVGVVKENTFDRYAKSRGLKEIGRFSNVTKPWVVRDGFNPQLEDELRSILLKLDDPEVLKGLKQSGFFTSEDKDYDFVRQGMRLSAAFTHQAENCQ